MTTPDPVCFILLKISISKVNILYVNGHIIHQFIELILLNKYNYNSWPSNLASVFLAAKK